MSKCRAGNCVGLLDAAQELDQLFGRPEPGLALLLEVLLVAGNRTGAVLGRHVCDLVCDGEPRWRLQLPAGTKRKRNGRASLPSQTAARLRKTTEGRSGDDWLFPSPRGNMWARKRFTEAWDLALALAWVRREAREAVVALMQKAVPNAELSLAWALAKGRAQRQPGNPELLKGATLGRWQETRRMVEQAAKPLFEHWQPVKARHTPYCLRHTHISIASGEGVPDACVDKQTGQKTRGMIGRYRRLAGPDIIDANRSAEAVAEALRRARESGSNAKTLRLISS